MKDQSTFSKNLKTARIIKGWTQDKAARKLYKSQPVYAKYESGEIEPSHDTLILICETFDILDLRLFISLDTYFSNHSLFIK